MFVKEIIKYKYESQIQFLFLFDNESVYIIRDYYILNFVNCSDRLLNPKMISTLSWL